MTYQAGKTYSPRTGECRAGYIFREVPSYDRDPETALM